MKIGIHDADAGYLKHKRFPNYALMKISAWHKRQGDQVEWWRALWSYDLVYSSKVFDFTTADPYLPADAIRGGTGYQINSKLRPEIDHMFPDYSIYPACDYAIGYITRGCPNHCRWCVVPEKEGDIHPYRTWRELVRPDSKKLVLMDNNILACDFGIQELQSLIGRGYQIDLNQGMDARLVTPEVAEVLGRLKWIRFIRFSCDQKSQILAVLKACSLLMEQGILPYKVFIYLLVTKDVEDAAYRVEVLKRLKGINLYAQAERNPRLGIMPTKEQLDFSQRYVYSGYYRHGTWQEYKKKHGG